MSNALKPLRVLHRLLWSLTVVIIIADQLSKAYFVWLLGSHQQAGFLPFLKEYFTIFATGEGAGGVVANYAVFKPLVWVWEPWIAWNLTTNTGAAWSLFEGNSYILSFVSLIMAALLWYVWRRKFAGHLAMTWALGAIIGGALGNFVDRFRLREVVDFVDVNIPLIGKVFPALGDPYDFPIFNIADSAAVCGTIALAIYLIASDMRSLKRQKPARKVTPFREGIQLDEEAKQRLRAMAAKQPQRTVIGLTVHIGNTQ